MKKSHIILILTLLLLLGVLIVLSLILLPDTSDLSAAGETTLPGASFMEDATALYTEAIAGIENADMALTIQESRTASKDGGTYQYQRNYTVRYDRSDPTAQRYYLLQELQIGCHSTVWEEYHVGRDRYLLISGLACRAQLPHTGIDPSLLETHPAVCLTPELYNKITATETENGWLLTFSEATAQERWVFADVTEVEYITATAMVNTQKQLLSYDYAVAYQDGTRRTEVSYRVTLTREEQTVVLPDPEGGWLLTNDITTPLLLEFSAGFLLQEEVISSTYQENIYFEALGDRRQRQITLTLDNRDELAASFITKTTTTKDSRLDQPEVVVKEERFADGKYTVGQNGSEGAHDPSVDADTMLRYLQNQLICSIMLPEFISGWSVETVGTVTRYTFNGNDAFAAFLCRNAGQQLYEDPDLLTGDTVSIRTDQLTCYLEVDEESGLPVGSGISFFGSYEMQGLPHSFSYEVSQVYQYNLP